MKFFIDDTKPYQDDKFFNEIRNFINEGNFVGNDACPHNNNLKNVLESNFKYNSANIVTCANGTDALLGALIGIGVKEGDEVIVPGVSWLSTSMVIKNLKATPVYVDIDETGLVNIDSIKTNISKKTKAIIVVHLYGQLVDIDQIKNFTNIPVIEDSAQAFGGSFEDKDFVGSKGDFGCFSFFPTKNLGCFGDGGMTIVNNEEYFESTRKFFRLGQSEVKGKADFVGINSRLDSLQAFILLKKLSFILSNDLFHKRKEIISDYKKAYSRILFNDNFHPVPHLAVGRFKNRTEIRDKMIQDGIPTAIHYPYALSDIKILEGKNSYECINSSKFCNEVLSFPFHANLEDSEKNKIFKELRNI